MARAERSRYLCSSAPQPAYRCQVLDLEPHTKKSKIRFDAEGASCEAKPRYSTPPPRIVNLDELPPPVRHPSKCDSAGDTAFSIELDEVSASRPSRGRFHVEPRTKCRKISVAAKAASCVEAELRYSTPSFRMTNLEERPPHARYPSRRDSAGDETFSPAPDEVSAPWPLLEQSWRPPPLHASVLEHIDFGRSPWLASDIQCNDLFDPMHLSI